VHPLFAERANQRPSHDFCAAGDPRSYETVLAELKTRDARDAGREAAPMRPAADAHLLDTTDLSIDEAFERAAALVVAARLSFRAQP